MNRADYVSRTRQRIPPSLMRDLDRILGPVTNGGWEVVRNDKGEGCGTGAGGFKKGNTCASSGSTTKLVESIKRNGGFTYHPQDDTSPKSGFSVAVHRDAERVIPLDNIKAEDILNYILNYRSRFEKDPDLCVGSWVDNGKIYLDLPKVVNDLDTALNIARKNDQIAVFDLKNLKSIDVPSTSKQESRRERESRQATTNSRQARRSQGSRELRPNGRQPLSEINRQESVQRGSRENATTRWVPVANNKSEGENCGTGAGGFQKGNSCAKGPASDRPHGYQRGAWRRAKHEALGQGHQRGSTEYYQDAADRYERIVEEMKTPPPPGPEYNPDVEKKGPHGITLAARVGVPAMSVPPPPPIGRMPNLTKHERRVETAFRNFYQADPDGVAGMFLDIVKRNTKPGDPPTFGTDDAKVLHNDWKSDDLTLQQRSRNRATLNIALHQTANAITKRAFLKHLDTLKEGDEVMVTVGGCGAGKGYSLGKVPEVLAMKQRSKAVWDSAGDQNATENPWIQREAERRGLKVTYAYVHADPYTQWAHPDRGVVKRAGDPSDGRMVDADVFADSYAIGARNHQKFYEANRRNSNARFVFLSAGARIDGIPPEALALDRDHLAAYARRTVQESDAPPHVIRGGTMGARVWGTSVRNEEKWVPIGDNHGG